MFYFSIIYGNNHHPNRLTHIIQRGRAQPPTRYVWMVGLEPQKARSGPGSKTGLFHQTLTVCELEKGPPFYIFYSWVNQRTFYDHWNNSKLLVRLPEAIFHFLLIRTRLCNCLASNSSLWNKHRRDSASCCRPDDLTSPENSRGWKEMLVFKPPYLLGVNHEQPEYVL